MKPVLNFIAVLTAVSLTACDRNKQTDAPASGDTSPMPLMNIMTDGHPESIAIAGERVFISCIGNEMNPTEKDGDGVIIETNNKGEIVAENAFSSVKMDAPKGMAVLGDILYVADIDRIIGLNLKTGEKVSDIDLSHERMRFLNDLAATPEGKLIASSTDTGQMLLVDPGTGTYSLLKTSVPIPGPNGLVLDKTAKTLYIAGYSEDDNGKGDGQLWSVDLSSGIAAPLCGEKGRFDGLALVGDLLYFSDWDKDGQTGAIRTLDLKTKEIADVTRIPMKGVADFLIDRKTETIWIPAMLEKKVIHAALVPPKVQ